MKSIVNPRHAPVTAPIPQATNGAAPPEAAHTANIPAVAKPNATAPRAQPSATHKSKLTS